VAAYLNFQYTSLRRGISNIRYDDTFRFTKRSLAALGMTIRLFYEGIKKVESYVSARFRAKLRLEIVDEISRKILDEKSGGRNRPGAGSPTHDSRG
jgi:hypothetical protein